jgi:hypothetical protein
MDSWPQFHQGVDADVGVGQFGGEGVAQPVDQCAAGAVGVDAGAAKRPQHPVLQGAAGDALTVGTHEQRRRRRPGGQSPPGQERSCVAARSRCSPAQVCALHRRAAVSVGGSANPRRRQLLIDLLVSRTELRHTEVGGDMAPAGGRIQRRRPLDRGR